MKSAARDLQNEYGLKVKNGMLYGVIDGYMCTFNAVSNILFVSCCVSGDAAARLNSVNVSSLSKPYCLSAVEIERERVTFKFGNGIGADKKIMAFFHEKFGEIMRSSGAAGDGVCTACGNAINIGEMSNIVMVNGTAHRVHAVCAQNLSQRETYEKNEYKLEEKNLGRGILGALLFALIGAVLWALIYSLGYFSALIGILVALLVKKGYELLGGKVCAGKAVVIIAATVLAVFVGQLAGNLIDVVKMISEDPTHGFSTADAPNLLMYLFAESAEFRKEFLLNLGKGEFFGILGGIAIFLKARAEHKTATINTEIIE